MAMVAMIKLVRSPVLKKLGWKLLLQVSCSCLKGQYFALLMFIDRVDKKVNEKINEIKIDNFCFQKMYEMLCLNSVYRGGGGLGFIEST